MEGTDIESVRRDIDEVYCEACQNQELERIIATENETEFVIKYKTFKSILVSLKEKYHTDECKFIKMYKRKLKFSGQSYSSLKDIYKMLKDELIPEYSASEYPVTSEEEWKRKRIEENLSIEEIKEQDKIRQKNIDVKVQMSMPVDLPVVETKTNTSLNLVIIGKTGVGKSATGNLIIGQKDFFSENLQANSTTEAVTLGTAEFKGRTLHVLDTPGLFDTRKPKEENKFKLAKCFTFDKFHEGVHAFILVLNSQAPRFTEEEQQVVKETKKMIGLEVFQHCILLLTHYDEYTLQNRPNARDFVENTNNQPFQKFLDEDLARRFMFIDNHSETDYERDMYRNNIIAMVENMPKVKQNHLFTNEMFEQAHNLWKKFQENELHITKSVIDDKLVKFYNAVFEVRNVIREQSSSSMHEPCNAQLKEKIYEQISKTKQMDIKIFEIVLGALKEICDDTLDEEYQEHVDGHQIENEAKIKMRNHVDVILKSEKLALAKTEIDLDQVSDKVLEMVSKSDRQHFITYEIVKKQVQNVIKKPLLRKYHSQIKEVVKKVNKSIFDIAKDVITEHPLKKSDIEKFQKKDADLYKELSDKVLVKLKTNLSEDIRQRFDEKELYDMINQKLLDRFGELESIAKKKFINNSSACFPANSFVYKNKGKKCLISELKIGDKVLTVNSSGNIFYEDIILLSHAEHGVMSVNVVLTVNSGETICLSPKHLIHVQQFGNLLPAYKVKIGDNLLAYNENSLKVVKVIGISRQVQNGMFSPHTPGGSVVVNDIIASCYTDHFNHKIAHVILSSVNILYKNVPCFIYQYLYGRDRLLNTPSLLEIIKPKVIHFPFIGHC